MNARFQEIIAMRFQEEATLADTVRQEISANRFRFVWMHISDGVEAVVRSTMDAMLVIATVFVLVWLFLPGSLHSMASDTASSGIGGGAITLFLAVFVVRFMVRMYRYELTKTYDRAFQKNFEKLRDKQDTVRFIEAVLKRHGLIVQQS